MKIVIHNARISVQFSVWREGIEFLKFMFYNFDVRSPGTDWRKR
jgi:hypothetical protein